MPHPVETADKIAAVVREWMTEFSVMPYDYEKNAVRFGIFMFVWAKKSGESQLTLISATKKMPKLDVLVERLRGSAVADGYSAQPQPARRQRDSG